MSNFWMVRAGEGGYLFDAFETASHIGIGWNEPGDLTGISSREAMRARIADAYPDATRASVAGSTGTTWRFRSVIREGDTVVTYSPKSREYLVGTVAGPYRYAPGVLPDSHHVRAVEWGLRISRDVLSPSSRNSLGSTLTIFRPGADVAEEFDRLLHPSPTNIPDSLQNIDIDIAETEEVEEEWQRIRRDLFDRAHEFIKDRIRALAPEDLEHLTAAVLRAMGYKTRVSPRGPDRGRDVTASPDGLGFQQPRIVAEVKHRPREAMGAPQIRSFLGGLRRGDNGLYVSTGGFTREARYEADRSSLPLTLIDLDDLATLVTERYDTFDTDGRALLPLTRVYWPAA